MVKGVCGAQDERWKSMAMMGTGSRCRKCNKKSEVLEGRYVTFVIKNDIGEIERFLERQGSRGLFIPELQFSPLTHICTMVP